MDRTASSHSAAIGGSLRRRCLRLFCGGDEANSVMHLVASGGRVGAVTQKLSDDLVGAGSEGLSKLEYARETPLGAESMRTD